MHRVQTSGDYLQRDDSDLALAAFLPGPRDFCTQSRETSSSGHGSGQCEQPLGMLRGLGRCTGPAHQRGFASSLQNNEKPTEPSPKSLIRFPRSSSCDSTSNLISWRTMLLKGESGIT